MCLGTFCVRSYRLGLTVSLLKGIRCPVIMGLVRRSQAPMEFPYTIFIQTDATGVKRLLGPLSTRISTILGARGSATSEPACASRPLRWRAVGSGAACASRTTRRSRCDGLGLSLVVDCSSTRSGGLSGSSPCRPRIECASDQVQGGRVYAPSSLHRLRMLN